MIDTILTIVKVVLAVLPFVIISFYNRNANLPTSERSRQFFMPVIAVVYVIAAMFLMDNLNDRLIEFIAKIPPWIAEFANVQWLPEKISELFIKLANYVQSLIESLNLHFWIFFISNTLVMGIFIVLKRLCIALITRFIKSGSELHLKIASAFYEFFPEKNKWCLKENFVQTRGIYQVFYFGALFISSALMVACRFLYFEEKIVSVFYPVFGVIIIGELYFYLDGATKREYSSDILGEDENAYRVVNYSLLRKFLRSVFGDKLLSENTSVNNALSSDVTTEEVIRELEKNEDQKIGSFATYMSALNKTGYPIDHNYLRSSLDMLNGKSILFNNPFYNDLIPYAFYPMNRVLLSHKKVLVVLGRHAIEDDIKQWLEKGIESVTKIPFLWNIEVLGKEEQKADIGIITRSDVLDIDLHNANADFLENVGFVVIIEPSKLISTAQIGLNLLMKKCRTDEEKQIVCCLCDKNCDGLVDAMSHILMTSITEVSATKKHLGTSSYMCWEADGDYLHHRLLPNISRYLGLGTELSFAALKNQVSSTGWFGGEAFPVTDMRWIDRQYYFELTKYAGLPTSQEIMDEKFVTTPNFWSAEIKENNYLTVEDESFNMFEILRDFSTRATSQGFINVISSQYLLKDYMADNASIFETDAKAIPNIVADYTRSNRNTILRLVLMMSTGHVNGEVLEKELSLLGISVFDLKKQLWYELYNCYAEVSASAELPEDYKAAVHATYSRSLKIGDREWTRSIIRSEETFDIRLGRMVTAYFIADNTFIRECVSELRSAGYVAEDEKGQKYYLGTELAGHIYQKYLPGQFFTFGGKYYEMQYLTADGQVLVRRAADHISGRPSYRQIREYIISDSRPSRRIGACKDINGLKVVREFADIEVVTPGYYRMERYNDFTTARKIAFEGENSGIPKRTYRNKEIIRIDLPDSEGKLTDNIRYTVTLLMNELFKTIFAENQAFISAVTDLSFLDGDNKDKPQTYSLTGEAVNSGSIYIIEDSQLDLGLTVAFERNIERIFSIIHDYLDWHYEKLEESLNPPEEPKPPIVFGDFPEEEKPKKTSKTGNAVRKAVDKIKGIFKRKPKKKKGEAPEAPHIPEEIPPVPEMPVPEEPIPETETPAEVAPEAEAPAEVIPEAEAPEEAPAEPVGEEPKEEAVSEEKEITPEAEEETSEEADEPASTEGSAADTPDVTEAPDNTGVVTANERKTDKAEFSIEKKPYHEGYYMLYGSDCEPSAIDLAGALGYLDGFVAKPGSLKQARDGKKIAEFIEATYNPLKADARYCDFCGTEIFGVEYETLADGRDRCLNCGRTAVKSVDEFRMIYEDVKRNMESFFGIRINAGIRVEMVNSKKLHKKLGKAFIPTKKDDPRIIGVAIKDKNGFTLMIENGSPRMATMLTTAHELTHIWQYINWNDKEIVSRYGKDMRLEIYEGMAKWVEIQYAYLINEPATAKREEIATTYRNDEYGRGFLRCRANYPFSTGTVITKATPFMNIAEPLDEQFCGDFRVIPLGGEAPVPEGATPAPVPVSEIPTEPVRGPIERDAQKLRRYAYSLLTDSEKYVYSLLLDAVNNFVPEVTELGAAVTDEQVKKIFDYIHRDHPEIFWFRHGATYYFDTQTHIVNKVELVYCLTEQEKQERQAQIEKEAEGFLSCVNDIMSDYEVVLRIYENIIRLVDYDTIGLERQKKTSADADKPDDLRSVYGVLVNKKAVCAGYAKAMQYLLNLCGIECIYVTSDTHAWNIVRLEGEYYHLDVTWGDGSDTKKDKNTTDAISYDCFCITTEDALRLEEHTPVSDFPVPECTATACNYHRRHGLFFDSFSYERIRAIVCESVKNGIFDLSFRFASAEILRTATAELIDGGKFREAVQYASLKSSVRLDTSYSYSIREDKLTVAFFLKKL